MSLEIKDHCKHKVCVVTGSTGGIGEGIARRLAADGFLVVVSRRRVVMGEEVARQINVGGGTACFLLADMEDPEACLRLIEGAVDRYGRLDVLVNNAGIFPIAEIRDTTADMWNRVFAINVRGAFLCAQAAIPHLKNQGWIYRQHRLDNAFPCWRRSCGLCSVQRRSVNYDQGAGAGIVPRQDTCQLGGCWMGSQRR